jgi:hypothetical protein
MAASRKVAECEEKAAEAHQKVLAAKGGQDRDFWHEIELKWLRLALSYRLLDESEALFGSKKNSN